MYNMNYIKDLNDLDTDTAEGKLLLAAIAHITTTTHTSSTPAAGTDGTAGFLKIGTTPDREKNVYVGPDGCLYCKSPNKDCGFVYYLK